VIDGPVQPLAVGVIVKVTVTGAFVVLINEPPISPVPLAAIPVTETVLFLVQLKRVLETLPEKIMVEISEPEQIVCDAGVATAFGTGFTTTVAVTGVPVHVTPALVNDGVIVNVTVTGALVVLVNVPEIFPAPEAAIPVTATVLFLVQLNTVPGTLPVNTIVVMAEPEQIVCDDGVAVASGIGFTVTVMQLLLAVQATLLSVLVVTLL
jgi:hypothetical protein